MKKWGSKNNEVFVPSGFKKDDVLLMQERFAVVYDAMKTFNKMDTNWNLFETEIDHGDLRKDPVRIYAMKTENRIGCGDKNIAKVVCGGDVYYYVSEDRRLPSKDPESALFFKKNSNGDFLAGNHSEGDFVGGVFQHKKPDLRIMQNDLGTVQANFMDQKINKWMGLIPEVAEYVITKPDVLEKFSYDNGKPDLDVVFE